MDAVNPRKMANGEPPMLEEHFLRGTTDFAKAAALLDLNAVESLLAAGTDDVDTGDVLNLTPLILLSRNRYSEADVPRAVEVIRRLIKAGARVTDDTGRLKRDQYGDATLHLAAMAAGHNGPAIMQALLEAIPPEALPRCVSAKCKNFGNTALHWATLNGQADTCEILIAHGASLTKKNRQKETVIDYAIKYERDQLKARYRMLGQGTPPPSRPPERAAERGRHHVGIG